MDRNMQPRNEIHESRTTRAYPSPRQPVLMVAHAHPDDESSQTGGTLAAYSAAGWRTILITCTDGAQGDGIAGSKPGQGEHDPKQVAQRRSLNWTRQRRPWVSMRWSNSASQIRACPTSALCQREKCSAAAHYGPWLTG